MNTRRQFLSRTAGGLVVLGAGPFGRADSARPKPPYRTLYSNDLTNILSCISPFHAARQPFRREMLEATVDEVAGHGGVDVHLLQPGLGSVPLWPSKVYPLTEHETWLRERYGLKLDPFTQFVRDGGDLVQIFIDRCRQRGQAPFISVRMNDAHHKEFADTPKGEKIPGSVAMSVTRFYAEHPEYRIGQGSKSSSQVVLNWAIAEVRSQQLALITELCANYDFDGLELDFLRFYSYFQTDKIGRDERCAIMTVFVREVRTVLDAGTRDGRHRWLCVRVPCYLTVLDELGLDLAALTAAGVDMVNASAHYFTTQTHDLPAIRQATQDAALYFELCHSTWNGPKMGAGYDVFPFRRATVEQLTTTAHQAYALGADGISAFNFAYYREHGSEGRGPFHEPEFSVFSRLRDPQAVATAPQHWFLAPGWRGPGMKPTTVPRKMTNAAAARFTLHLAPPASGWKGPGRLRIQGEQSFAGQTWTAVLNGQALTPTDDVSEPYPNPDPPLLGTADNLRAWMVPAEVLHPGKNDLELRLTNGDAATVVFVDLAIAS